jgi:tetratricopeptide (TPR) repeat protein
MKVDTLVRVCVAMNFCALAVATPRAEWAGAGTPVPAQRLLNNLERRVAQDRRNADLLTNLARLHAYLFATKLKTALETREGLFASDYDTDLPARRVTDPLNPGQRAEAARHLERALKRYRQALDINSRHLIARLGLAWCLEQSERESEAISQYRTLFDHAYAEESKLTPDQNTRYKPFVTEEAGRRLLDLLGSSVSLNEERYVRQRMQAVGGSAPRAITPLVVPLDPAWSPNAPLQQRAIFDADGSGVPKSWSWIPPAAAWLVYDDRGGKIESALQMFGSVTFWMFWENGYDALCSLDDSGDGILTGTELKYLALWRDADIDGVSDPGEVTSLNDHGIAALSCRHVVDTDEDSTVAAYATNGVTFRDGSTRPTYDLILRSTGEQRRP